MDVRIGWAELDATATPFSVCVGFAEFDAVGNPLSVFVGWAELDCLAPNEVDPIPPYRPRGGVSRYHSDADNQYHIPLDDFNAEADDEEIIMAILMEIAQDGL